MLLVTILATNLKDGKEYLLNWYMTIVCVNRIGFEGLRLLSHNFDNNVANRSSFFYMAVKEFLAFALLLRILGLRKSMICQAMVMERENYMILRHLLYRLYAVEPFCLPPFLLLLTLIKEYCTLLKKTRYKYYK